MPFSSGFDSPCEAIFRKLNGAPDHHVFSLRACAHPWYGNLYLGQKWPVAWWHQAITWINVDFSLVRLCGIHLRSISHWMLKLLFTMSLNIMLLKLLPHHRGQWVKMDFVWIYHIAWSTILHGVQIFSEGDWIPGLLTVTSFDVTWGLFHKQLIANNPNHLIRYELLFHEKQ